MQNTSIFDKDLNPLLEGASNEDLEPIVGYLSKKLSESLTGHGAYKRHNPDHSKYADLLAQEIRAFGGNSIVNKCRGEGPAYIDIVKDVANELKVNFHKENDIETIENSILEKIITKTFEKMSDEEKQTLADELGMKHGSVSGKGAVTTAMFIGLFRAGGFKSYQMTLIIANQIAKMILGKGLTFATNAALTRTIAILAGPIGWAIAGIWTAVDLAGPSYKTTIPCVIHIAMLRKKYNGSYCNNCDAMNTDKNAKFCSECGTVIV